MIENCSQAAKLWVIMPVYNEQGCVEKVVEEWLDTLHDVVKDNFILCIINDGSTDGTLDMLNKLRDRHNEVKIITKVNSGHGQSCIYGYKEALNNNAEWIFQFDSDGQCDPVFFNEFWKKRNEHNVIYGYRIQREDGIARFIISRITSLVVFCCAGVMVRDSNVPYRLMHKSSFNFLERIPADFYLANIPVAVFQQNLYGIRWLPIKFRRRAYAGKTKLSYFVRQAFLLAKQLRQLKPQFFTYSE